jgi:hypothetical protein
MRLTGRTVLSVPPRSAFVGFRFPPEVIVLAVRWYLRFGLSYRDVEELLAERGIAVDHVTVHRWVQRFSPLLVDAARFGRHRVGDRWFVDETYVKVAAGGFTCAGRLTSSGRSSTCTRRPCGTAGRRVGSFNAPGKPPAWCRPRSRTAHRPTRRSSIRCGRPPGTTSSGTARMSARTWRRNVPRTSGLTR